MATNLTVPDAPTDLVATATGETTTTAYNAISNSPDSKIDTSKPYTTEPDPGSTTIFPPGIKRYRASYGQFWYGKSIGFPGFLYKKNNGVAGRRSTTMAPGGNSNCNTYQNVNNAYTPGSGVGGSSIAVRRAKRRYATINTNNYA